MEETEQKRRSNDKDIFERAKERIANGDDRLSAANGGVRKGSLGDGTWKKQTKRRSNDKDRFQRAKERIAIGDDRLSAANGGGRKGSLIAR